MHGPIIQVDETTLRPDASTQLIGQHAYPNAICITAHCPGTATHQDAATIEDEVESTSAVEALSLSLPIQDEQQVISRPGRPQKDPALSPRERTRLRVQRHRDQQHLTKAQQIVKQFNITQELPPTVEFSGLTLHNNRASSISPDKVQPGLDCRPDNEPDPEPEVEQIPHDPGGPDFLRAQSDVYDRVLGTFFNRQCNCPNSCEHVEPENTYTLQEHIEHIGRSLPPLQAIFAERDKACDPHASFPQWHSFLSDKPAKLLSLRKSQASLSQDTMTIARQWDIDSIWLGAKNLSAIRAPNQFRLSFFLPHKSNLSTDQVIQPHGLDLAHTRHTSIGTFTTAGVRFSVLIFFPNGAPIYETDPDHVKQEIPGSYDLIYAKSRAYQEKPGIGRWGAEDESRSYRLAYGIPASVLSQFWAAVVRDANRHHVPSKKGDAIPYFKKTPSCLSSPRSEKHIRDGQSSRKPGPLSGYRPSWCRPDPDRYVLLLARYRHARPCMHIAHVVGQREPASPRTLDASLEQ
ncbi:hypothetical protein FOCG_18236 [Fusarium oxysporum f. sp. radicis-lycopersici 26381]|nr:hypothetical protein FOCG_18236 [Fusarium oxysporum f. sp. radicis-lycopersici 26381]